MRRSAIRCGRCAAAVDAHALTRLHPPDGGWAGARAHAVTRIDQLEGPGPAPSGRSGLRLGATRSPGEAAEALWQAGVGAGLPSDG